MTTSGHDFRQTALWRQAFETPRSDALPLEQEFFRNQYLLLRDKAAQLVTRIAVDLPGMTVHDVTHLDALWETASLVSDGALPVNPAEAFVLGASILLHDSAMSLAAYPNGLADVKQTLTWQDAAARLSQTVEDQGGKPFSASNVPKEFEAQLVSEVLRRLHAEQAEKLAEQNWTFEGQQIFLIDDPEVRQFYGPTIGQIAHSHWWSVQKVESDLAGDLGGLATRTKNVVDRVKLACLLRVADALHLDSRRAPRFLRAITRPVGISDTHWAFQERIARPMIELDAVVFTVGKPFAKSDAEAWWLAFDTLNAVDRELTDVDQLLQSRGREVLKARRVKGVGSPETLARILKTRDWRPIDARLQVSDVPRIVENLGGAKLYGDDPTVALRELIQNAADAVQARRRFESRNNDFGSIHIGIESRSDGEWLTVEDNGIGMSELVLTGPLLDFGNSFWRSSLAMEEFPGLMASGMNAIGRFGIGFFSVFMLGSEVKVFSRRCDRGVDDGRVLEFRSGTAGRPILSQARKLELPKDGGTRVEVKLKRPSSSRNGLLAPPSYRREALSLARVVAALAPSLDVSLYVTSAGEQPLSRPGDWLDLSERGLAARIHPELKVGDDNEDRDNTRLRTLTDQAGRVFGRAAINPSLLGSLFGYGGRLTIAGLSANKLNNIDGLLIGEPTTAVRDVGSPSVDRNTLRQWATEQAQLIAATEEDEEEQAKSAEVVLCCGGEIGDLKIIKWGANWLNATEFRKALQDCDEFYVSFEGEFSYEEDFDDVMPREFRDRFIQSDNVAIVLSHDGNIVKSGRVVWPTSLVGSEPILQTRVADYVDGIIFEILGVSESETTNVVVGEVNSTEIEREVELYSRITGDEAVEIDQQDA